MKESIIILFIAVSCFSINAQYLITDPDSLSNNGAEYVIITHADFTDELYPLCELRDSLGLSVKMVEVDLIYSSFDDDTDPEKIKQFTQQMYDTWDPRPEYILLVGDANFESSSGDYIPSPLFPKFSYSYLGGYTTHASDNWYVQLDGDDYLPDCAIGRFMVSSVSQCRAMVNKTVAYETQNATPGSWQRTIGMVISQDFESYAFPLLDSFFIPANDTIIQVLDRDGPSSAALRQKTIDMFNQGIVFLFMVAHGSSTPIWLGEHTLFRSEDIAELTNDIFPVVFGRG